MSEESDKKKQQVKEALDKAIQEQKDKESKK